MDGIEPKHLEEVLQTLEEELKKMNPPELQALEEEIANESAAAAKKQMEEIQQLKPKERDFFRKRLAQELAKLKPIFEKWHKQEVENARRGYYYLKRKRIPIPKSVRQYIPAKIKTPAEKQEEINNFLQENFSDLLAKQVC